MFFRRASHAGVALLCFSIFAISGFAQSERGTITGAVRDSSGAVIPGAAVKITNEATNVSLDTVTNAAGDYTLPSLPPASYTVRVEKQGFRPFETKGLTLQAGGTVRADATLQVGAASQTVEVQANAVQLQTEDARQSTVLENRLINDLPLQVAGTVRTPFDLAGVTPEAKNVGGDNGFMLAGGQAAAYGTSLDGVSANTSRALSKSWIASNSPSVEAIDQFSVDTAGYKAEFGHAAGNITFASKSGTNQYHGSAYWFLRNNDFDANTFYNNLAGIPISIYKQNDFGATFGGPVWIPKVYHGKDKTFFFFSYEGFRNRAGANGQTFTVPTPEMYNGDFSNWVYKDTAGTHQIPIYNPTSQTANPDGTFTRQVFPGNVIPQSLFSASAMQALKVFQTSGKLVPNNGATPGSVAYVTSNYFENGGTNVNPVNKASIKGDHIFNERHRISGYYGWDRERQVCGPDGCPTLPGLYSTYNDLTQASDVLRFQWDWMFSPTKLNHFYAGGNNWTQDHKPPQEYIGNWKSKFCLPNVPDCNENLVNLFSGGTGDNYSTWGGPADNGSENTVYSYNDDFTWIKGSHTIKFGGMYQLNHYNGFGRQCEAGCVGFSYQDTGVPGGTNANNGGNAFASFLLGYANSGSIDTVRFIGQQFPYFAGFAQDDWRVTPKLVINYGVRWDGNLPPTGLDDRWADFSPTTPNPAANNIPGAVLFAGSGQGRVGTRTLADMWPWGFGPHVGLAYSYDQKTVIRASFARSYGSLVSVSGSTHTMGFTLTQGFNNTSNGVFPTYTLEQGMPAWTAPPFINPSVSNGTSVSWFQGQEATHLPAYDNINFSIQRQLSSSIVLNLAYVGVMGEHLQTQLLQYNSLPGSDLTAFGSTVNSINVLNSQVGSALANQYGITAPFANFGSLWGTRGTVAQALRPFPQYTNIDTYSGEGDHSGHSTYHAGEVTLQKRYSAGLVFQASYVFSKLLTDADTAWGEGYAADQFNRRLEKSIGQFDITHDFKISASYDLPFGKGKQYLTSGPAAWIIGGWRLAGIGVYDTGTPVAISSSLSLPIYASGQGGRVAPYVTSYNGWQPSSFNFEPGQPFFFVPYETQGQLQSGSYSGPFPYQGDLKNPNNSLADQGLGIGNVTRYNPKVRNFPNLNENLSITREFPIHEQIRMEFRAEAFNIFNRMRFGTGSTQLQSSTFGQPTGSGIQANSPRSLQLALKLYF
ncbi:MAG TPA: carboxypeptidase-like regulatory domain-containing protein [Bryobacteraceae bacterium]|nr:carboxypeptidase-like regulatory domain-containing protein [Bryobacteraceae bacterium]